MSGYGEHTSPIIIINRRKRYRKIPRGKKAIRYNPREVQHRPRHRNTNNWKHKEWHLHLFRKMYLHWSCHDLPAASDQFLSSEFLKWRWWYRDKNKRRCVPFFIWFHCKIGAIVWVFVTSGKARVKQIVDILTSSKRHIFCFGFNRASIMCTRHFKAECLPSTKQRHLFILRDGFNFNLPGSISVFGHKSQDPHPIYFCYCSCLPPFWKVLQFTIEDECRDEPPIMAAVWDINQCVVDELFRIL